jgi:hypothetical protein
VTVLAVIRPDEWNLPLLVHVAGAALLVGALVLAAGALLLAARSGEGSDVPALTRFGSRTILFAVIPSFIIMRVGAELILSEEDLDPEPDWIGIGYGTSDLGLLLIIAAAITGVIAARRAGQSRTLGAAAWLCVIVLVLSLVAVWAMTAKPG